jgi:hypothetical protein
VLVLAVGLVLPLGLSVAVVLAIACISVPADFSPETSLVRDERIPARAALAQCRERLQRRPRLSAPARRARIRLGGNHGRRRARLRRRGPAGLIAVLVGAAVGAAIGGVTRFADERGWTEPQSMRIAFIAAPLIVFAAAVMLHGNGFVAVFVAGIAIRLTRGEKGLDRAELTLLEDVSWLTNLLLAGIRLRRRRPAQRDVRLVAGHRPRPRRTHGRPDRSGRALADRQ